MRVGQEYDVQTTKYLPRLYIRITLFPPPSPRISEEDLISPELSEDESFRERFRVKWRPAACIEYPNVVPIDDVTEADGQLYITMRYIEGKELKALLETE